MKNDDTLLTNIEALLEKEEVGTVVIGVHKSSTYYGEQEGEKLGKQIGNRFKVAVEYQDEMFTSKMAQDNLVAQGYRKVATLDDAEAARILLQSFLDKRASLSLSEAGDL